MAYERHNDHAALFAFRSRDDIECFDRVEWHERIRETVICSAKYITIGPDRDTVLWAFQALKVLT